MIKANRPQIQFDIKGGIHNDIIKIRIPEKLKENIRKTAKEQNLKMSDFIRYAVLGEIIRHQERQKEKNEQEAKKP